VEFRFNAIEWGCLKPSERIVRCRKLAGEAQTLSDGARGHTKALFLELAMQWKILAEEVALESSRGS
jgi:hypothetical protein